MSDTFTPRDLTIAHRSVWESLDRWAEIHSVDISLAIPARTPDDIDCYMVVPRSHPTLIDTNSLVAEIEEKSKADSAQAKRHFFDGEAGQ